MIGLLLGVIMLRELPKPMEAKLVPVQSYEYWSNVVDTKTSDEDERAWLKRVMWCESNGKALASNKYSSAKGLYQFLDSTWAYECTGDVLNGNDNMNCALKMLRQGKQNQWSCK